MKALIPEILEIFSAISFIFYGILSFTSNIMKSEFKRWGISQFRVIVGIAQLCGGIGLIIGFYIPVFTLLSSFGLTILMLLGFILRIMVKDGMLKSFPSFFYFLINVIILYNFLKNIL
jgi:uncharacterized membrane protein YphA (DoxX/SURF4 family)|tara:strand:+ start:4617 stop:4970 length:354 start_codon:yes stop_codon:yes gene_type:complete